MVHILLLSLLTWGGVSFAQGQEGVFSIEKFIEGKEPIEVVGNLGWNSDFPLLLLKERVETENTRWLVGIDARNGKALWSLKNDPAILIIRYSGQEDAPEIKEVLVDAGFIRSGRANSQLVPFEGTGAYLKEILKIFIRPNAQGPGIPSPDIRWEPLKLTDL